MNFNFGASWSNLFGASLILVSFFLSPFSQASDCDQINLSGRFKLSNGQSSQDGRSYFITQQNCIITIVENGPKQIVWNFDLAGLSAAKAPEEIVAAQRAGGELGVKSLESLSAKTELVQKENGSVFPQTILVNATMNLPKAEKNRFNVDVQLRGVIHLETHEEMASVDSQVTSPGKPVRIDFIRLEKMKARLTSINDKVLRGGLARGFLTGANYILDAADDVLTFWFGQLINLERID